MPIKVPYGFPTAEDDEDPYDRLVRNMFDVPVGGRAPSFPGSEEGPPDYGELEDVLAARTSFGYSREELLYAATQGTGGTSPQEVETRLDRILGQQYGQKPEGAEVTDWQWRQMGAGRRAREYGAVHWPTGPGAPQFPRAEEWGPVSEQAGQPMFTRAGARSFYPVESMMQGTYWLPGEEEGTTRIPIEPGKIAKRGQLGGAHEMLTPFGPEGGSMMQRGAFKSAGAPGYEYGFSLRAAIPLTGVLPEGMGMLQEGAIGSFRQRMTRDVKLPEGFEPQGMPEIGQAWNIGAGEKVTPFEGGTPLNLGSWQQAELMDVMKTEGGMRYVFERGISPEQGVSFKSFLSKAMMGVGDVAGFTGRSDIQAVIPPKEILGMYYSWAQNLSPEQVEGYLGAEAVGKSWQDVGNQLLPIFAQQVLPGMYEPSMKFGERESPALVGEFFMQARREYPTRRPRIPYRELQKLRDVAPGVYQQVMAESAETRAAYGGMLGAAAANIGGFAAPEGAISPTQEQLQMLMAQSQIQAQEATGAESLATTPRASITAAVMNVGQEMFGAAPLQVGKGQYFPSFQTMGRFMAGGALATDESSALGGRVSAALQSMASNEAWEARPEVESALAQIQAMAGGKNFMTSAMSAYLGPRAGGIAMTGSEKLVGAEIGLPTETVQRAYGLKPGSAEAEEFLQAWNVGDIRPTAMAMRFPTSSKGPLGAGIEVLSPAERGRRGVELSAETPTITSMGVTQMLQGDWDADMLARYMTGQLGRGEGGQLQLTGGMARATNEQIAEFGEQAKGFGAEDVQGLLGQPVLGMQEASLEELQKKYDPETWQTYTPEQIQEHYQETESMRQRIGPTFNLIESIQRAAQDPVGEAAGEKLMGRTYGIQQRPADLPPAEQRLFDMLQRYNPATGGYLTSEGKPASGGKGMGGFAGALSQQMGEVVRSGTYTPSEAAGLLAAPGRAGGIEAALKQFAATPEGDKPSARAVTDLSQAVGGASNLMQSPMGAALPIAYERMRRIASRELGEDAPEYRVTGQRRTRAYLERMQKDAPERTEALSQGWEDIRAYRAAVSKNPEYYPLQERLQALETVAPELAASFGIRSQEAPRGETDWDELGEETRKILFGPDPGIPFGAGTGATGEWVRGGGAGTGGVAGGGGRGIPTTPSAAAAPAMPGPGGGGGGVGGQGSGTFMERMFGVSKGQFEEAVDGLTKTLDLWNEQIKPAINAGEDLTRSQRAVTRQLETWRNVNEKALRQGGWGTNMDVAVSGGEALRGSAGYESLRTATSNMRINAATQALGGGGDGGRGAWGQIGRGLGGIGRRLMSGWGLMQMRRFWQTTGGYAMSQIPVAAQEEQAMMRAGMAGAPMGQAQLSPMGLDMMSLQASQQNFRADVGRAAYGAWGWTQGAMGQGAATAAGIGLPAVGGGLMAGQLAGWAGLGAAALPVGLGVAGGVASLGAGAWAGYQMSDRERMAIGTTGERGPVQRGLSMAVQRPEWMQRLAMGVADVSGILNPALPLLSGGARLAGFEPGQMEGLPEYGQQLISGDLEGLDPTGRMASIAYATEQATGRGGRLSFMTQTQAAGQAADYMRYTPGATNIQDVLGSDLFRTMAMRGETTAPYRQMAAQWGKDPTQWQGMADFSMQMPEAEFSQFQYASQFYAPLARFGMTPETAQGMGVPGAQDQRMLQGMAGGSQYWWSQFGQDTGNEWAVTQDPTTGMGIGTNWGGDILQGRLGQTGQAGQNIDVSGGDITFNVTGQTVGFNQWDIQDYATEQQRGNQDWQYEFKVGGLDLAQGRQYEMWGFQDEGRDLSRGYQQQQFGFQREGMAQGDRQFRQRWQLGWDRMMGQDQWGEEDRATQWGRQQKRFGWQLEDIAFSGAKTSLSFGWQMEDLEQSERTATGRDRRRIRTQRERAAIQFGMGMGQLDTREGRVREQMGWAEDDHEKAEQRHSQTLQWRQQEMRLQMRHHTERLGLQRRRQDASEQYFRATSNLQDRQTRAARDYWEVQHDRQRESLEKGREHLLLAREIQDAQTALSRAQQLQVNAFRVAFESGGPIREAWGDFVEWARAEVAEATAGSTNTYLPTRQYDPPRAPRSR